MLMTHVTHQALLNPQCSGGKGRGGVSRGCRSWLSLTGSWHPTPTTCISITGLCRGVSEEHSALRRDLDDLEFTLSFHFAHSKYFLSITEDLLGMEDMVIT